jgi:predicted nucleotidyltransferase
MNSIESGLLALQQLEGKPKFETMFGVASTLTTILEESGLKAVIVGGFAVEIYTRSEYTTVDIDLIFSRRDIANDTLLNLGFTKEGRHWYHSKLGVSIEIPNDMLENADTNKIIKLNLANQEHVYVIGIEDIILDRLRACIHSKSTSDCGWGYRLFLIHQKTLDIKYMIQKSAVDLTSVQLQAWIAMNSETD